MTDKRRKKGKRTRLERDRDMELVAQLHYQGKPRSEIANILNSRSDIIYTISPTTVSADLTKMRSELAKRQMETIELARSEQLVRISLIEREAWDGWLRSKEPAMEEKTIEKLREFFEKTEDGEREKKMKMVLTEVEKLKKNQAGDVRFLDTLLRATEQRSRLYALYTNKFDIKVDKKEEIHVKTYHIVHPGMWEDPSIQVIDGEIIKGELVDGKK